MRKQKPVQIVGAIVIILSSFFLIRCSDSPNNASTDPNNQGSNTQQTATAFENETELESYLKEQFAKSIVPQYYYATDDLAFEDSAEAPAAGAAENSTADASASATDSDTGFSDTNNQESGVDESDKTKTDGTYIYVAGTNDIAIIDVSNPEAMQKVFSDDIDGQVSALHLYQNVLAVLYISYTAYEGDDYQTDNLATSEAYCPYWIPVNTQTGVRLYDVSDPVNAVILKDTTIDGNLISTRLIDGKLHVVQKFLPNLPPLEYYYDGTVSGHQSTISSNTSALDRLTLDQMLPSYEVVDQNNEITEEGRLVEPQNFYRPATEAGGSMVTISTFDLDHPARDMESVGIVANADIVYASQKALYVIASQWGYYLAYADTNDSTNQVTTEIQKFDLTGDKVVSAGSGTVTGTVLNQFSLGEYEDVLRIATSNANSWNWRAEEQSTAVYCLQNAEDGNSLEVIGKIEDIAPGENLYAARFIGTRGYLVTFVQIDPLITLDLTDPTNPEIAGELKVPGYSSYIHPISDDLLLTIGKDTETVNGRVLEKGVQLSIFDISDFSNPQLLHKETIGDRGTYSEALYDHKSFNYWSANSLLAFPLDLYKEASPSGADFSYGTYQSSGLYVYRIDAENGFDFLGSITTAEATDDYSYWYYGNWTRGIFIDQHVFTVQENTIYTAQIDDIENTVQKLVIKEGNPPYDGYYPEEGVDEEAVF